MVRRVCVDYLIFPSVTFTVDNGAMVAKVTNLSLDYTTNFSYDHKIVEGELISAGMSSPNTSMTYSYGLQASGQVSGSKTVEEVLLTGERWFWVGWLPIQVTNNVDAPMSNVNVYFQVSSGGGTVDNDHVKTNDQGIAEVNWTLGQDGTDQQLAATVKNGNGSLLSGTPVLGQATISMCHSHKI